MTRPISFICFILVILLMLLMSSTFYKIEPRYTHIFLSKWSFLLKYLPSYATSLDPSHNPDGVNCIKWLHIIFIMPFWINIIRNVHGLFIISFAIIITIQAFIYIVLSHISIIMKDESFWYTCGWNKIESTFNTYIFIKNGFRLYQLSLGGLPYAGAV